MNSAIVVDINTDREKDHQVIIQQVIRKNGDEIIPIDEYDIIHQMAMLCEGLCMLIHCADQEGIKPSYKSVKDCIKHITDGFADASYVASITQGPLAQE